MQNLPRGLTALEARVRHDLESLNYPGAGWMPPPAGTDVDVLIAGAGMCGQTAAFALLREGVRNLRIIDRAARGEEGPWATFARMETLRSPKQLTGPDLGVPSLTFRQWYEAQHGAAGWEALYKIPRLMWRDYLLWVRDAAGVPVENRTALVSLEPVADGVRAVMRGPGGEARLLAKRVVLALGRDGAGHPRTPGFPSLDHAAARGRVFHSVDPVDFQRLAGQRIGILGVGATAFDNAGSALESGARSVTMFARRAHLAQVNKSKGVSYPGFQRGFAALDDADRWAFMRYIFDEQVPPPHESVLRCTRHPEFALRFAEPWSDVQIDDGGVRVTTPAAVHRFDAVILATGFDVDLADRPELAKFEASILRWSDRIAPSEARTQPELARFPYLGPGFELLAREGSAALSRIHLFNWGSTMSHGQLAGDIPGLAVGVARLTDALVRALFVEGRDSAWAAVQAFDEPELAPTPYFVPREQRGRG